MVTESRGLVMVFVRGDHRVNEIKLANALGEAFRPARRRGAARAPAASWGRRANVPTLCDEAIVPGQAYVTGANRPDYHHVITVDGGERGDVRSVEVGDTVNGHPIRIEPAIEIGNIFKLGTRYSEPLGATYLDENGKEQLIAHGLLRHRAGPHDGRRDRAVRRREGDLLAAGDRAVGRRDRGHRQAGHARARGRRGALRRAPRRRASRCSSTIATPGPGEKFADAELLGVPLRLTVGKRSLESGRAEAQARRGRADHDGGVPLTGAAEAVRELWTSLP